MSEESLIAGKWLRSASFWDTLDIYLRIFSVGFYLRNVDTSFSTFV